MMESSDGVGAVWKIGDKVIANGDPFADPERKTSLSLIETYGTPF
jgi:hypothetical protein